MRTTHPCPATGCDVAVPMSELACRAHWARVSRPTQQRVYRTWRARQRLKTIEAMRAHHRAMGAAELEMNSWADLRGQAVGEADQ